ncbi:MAG: stage II sporulation protein D [Clostridia bacterium]|nr:stage II sporulation protein D [Clostridia bacterium]
MRKFFVLSVFLLALLLLLPLAALRENPPSLPVLAESTVTSQNAQTTQNTESFKVLISETGKTETLTREEYLFGVVAGEMPALYEEEALKAQAVCAYTFLKWRQKENSDKEYDITDNYQIDQCYISEQKALEKWGSKADEYSQKIKNAIESVLGQALNYNGEIILSVYHAVSGGITESAKNVWGKEYPYLQSVSSVGDKLSANYITTVDATKEKIEGCFSVTLPTGLKGTFTDFKRTSSGYVKSVKICGKEFSGSEIREIMGLKSTNFSVTLKDNIFTFTVYGYGHGVGMSQNGANYMAQQGSDYKEILAHYYKGSQIMRNS